MKIAVILEYFEYFIHLSEQDSENEYYFFSIRKRFKGKRNIVFEHCDLKDHTFYPTLINHNKELYFKQSLLLSSIPKDINLDQIANFFEKFFEESYIKYGIELVISGATTGFEKYGLSIAKRMGLYTLYIWEGFFRPYTISYDFEGMNAEASFAKINESEINDYCPTNKFRIFYEKYISNLKDNSENEFSLARIQNGRFNIIKQFKKRIQEIRDFERIRLSFPQLLKARMGYYWNKNYYSDIKAINSKFIFFPLQTHTDSNIVLNSNMHPLSKSIENIIYQFLKGKELKNYKLVVKEHPLDVFRIYYNKNFGDRVFWLKPEIPVSKIILNENCIGTLVVNSTSGFESLLLNKPVLTLGNAFYNKKKLASKVNNLSLLPNKILDISVTELDAEFVFKFAGYIFDNHQLLGNLDNKPNRTNIDEFRRLLNKLNK
jgi:capsular polysaccharide export protein